MNECILLDVCGVRVCMRSMSPVGGVLCVNVRTDHRHRMRFFRIVYIIATQSHARLGFLYILNCHTPNQKPKSVRLDVMGTTKNNIT